jgi:hypothetical protein
LFYNSIIFAILLLFVVVTFRSQFDLYHLSFSSTDYTFNSSKISSFPLLVKNVVPAVFLGNLISIDANRFLPFFLSFQNSLPYKKRGGGRGEPVHYVLLFLKISGPSSFKRVV